MEQGADRLRIDLELWTTRGSDAAGSKNLHRNFIFMPLLCVAAFIAVMRAKNNFISIPRRLTNCANVTINYRYYEENLGIIFLCATLVLRRRAVAVSVVAMRYERAGYTFTADLSAALPRLDCPGSARLHKLCRAP